MASTIARRWPLVGREAERSRLLEALTGSEPAHGVIRGALGVGKTALGHTVLEDLAPAVRTEHAVATRTARGIPLGAFAHLLPPPRGLSGTPHDLLHCATHHLRGSTRDPLVIMVDDAQWLDPTSLALLSALSVTGARVLATLRTGEDSAEVLTALDPAGETVLVDLDPLCDEVTAQVLEAGLDGPVTHGAAQALWRRSRGNPLVLREHVLSAVASGALAEADDGWQLRARLDVPERLAALICARLGGLSNTARRTLDLLALGEPLEIEVLAATGADGPLADLEDRHLVELATVEGRMVARLGHPLQADVLKAAMPRARRRALRGELADAAESAGRVDVLRTAAWRLAAGQKLPGDVALAAARRAAAGSDHDLANQLATAAEADGAGAMAVVVRATAEAATGAPRDAVRALEAVPVADDDERAEVAEAIAHIRSAQLSQPSEALAVLERAQRAVSDGDAEDRLQVASARLRTQLGDPLGGLQAVEGLLGPDTADTVRLGAAQVSTAALTLTGRCNDALDLVDAHLRLADAHRDTDPVAATSLRVHRIAALTLAGRLKEAESESWSGHQSACRHGCPTETSQWALALAMVLVERGQVVAAAELLGDTAPLLDGSDPLGLEPGRLALLALAEAQSGRIDEASATLAAHDLLTGGSVHRHQLWALRARTWVAAITGDLDAAVEHAETAAREGRSRDLAAWGAALHDGARVGAPEVAVDGLRALAGTVESELVDIMSAHAAALIAEDPTALEDVAHRFSAIGADLLAVEAATQAVDAAEDPDDVARCSVLVDDLSLRCPGAKTVAADTTGWMLSHRERTIAELAAQGLTSRDIADRLTVSVRTVDNHLYRAYRKLGIDSRDRLAAALALHQRRSSAVRSAA